MKLAEALILRADCQKKIEQLRARLARSAKVQEGEKPSEDPAALMEELNRTAAELANLVKRINKTNSTTQFESGTTFSDALADRDILMIKRRALDELIQAASITVNRFSRSEVKYFSTVNIAEVQKEIDRLSKVYRELDARIQAANWQVDLIET